MAATLRDRSLSIRPVRTTQKSAVPTFSFTVYILFSNPISTTVFKIRSNNSCTFPWSQNNNFTVSIYCYSWVYLQSLSSMTIIPLPVGCTWGAGGSRRPKRREIVSSGSTISSSTMATLKHSSLRSRLVLDPLVNVRIMDPESSKSESVINLSNCRVWICRWFGFTWWTSGIMDNFNQDISLNLTTQKYTNLIASNALIDKV